MEGHGRQRRVGGRFGVGIVGLGEGSGLLQGLHGHPDLPVLAICDVDATRVERARRRYDVPFGSTELGDLLDRPDIDIVAIYTPDRHHLEHIRAAFEAGKHVVCTKPLVTSLEEARAVLALADAHPDLRLMVGQSSRFFGPMRRQRDAVVRGDLGEIHFAEASYVHDMRWFYGNRPWAREPGGLDLIFGGCSHPVDLLRWHMGPVTEVLAWADRSSAAEDAGFPGEDVFVIQLRFANGRLGRVLGLYGLEQPHAVRPWIEVSLYGRTGTFIASYPQLQTIQKLEGDPERVEHYFEDSYHYFQFEGVNHHAGEFVEYVEAFATALARGEAAQPDARDGAGLVATLEAIRSSVRSGRPERVPSLEARGAQ